MAEAVARTHFEISIIEWLSTGPRTRYKDLGKAREYLTLPRAQKVAASLPPALQPVVVKVTVTEEEVT